MSFSCNIILCKRVLNKIDGRSRNRRSSSPFLRLSLSLASHFLGNKEKNIGRKQCEVTSCFFLSLSAVSVETVRWQIRVDFSGFSLFILFLRLSTIIEKAEQLASHVVR